MSNQFVFTNNATTTLTSAISASSTTLQVASGAAFPAPSTGQQFAIWMTDAATGLVHECIYVTANASNQFTALRGQEGTAATAWVIGDIVQHVVTAGSSAAAGQTGAANTWSGPQTYTGNNNFTGTNTFTQEVIGDAGFSAAGADSGGCNFRAIGGNYGVMLLNDGTNAYLLQTASGTQTGGANAYRPLKWNLTTGAVAIDGTGAGVTFGGNATFDGAIYAAVGTGFSHVQVFIASGTFTAPAGVTLVHARVWGGGGGGGGAAGTAAAAGGGGGGYAEGIYTVVPGTAYPVTVGVGGALGNGNPSAGGPGGTSAFGSFASATGGTGGGGAASGVTTPVSGGSGSGGVLNVSGFASGGGILGTGVQIAGAGGGTFGTSNTATTSSGAGASFPGGGGGGGATTSSTNGAAGSPGLVIIQW